MDLANLQVDSVHRHVSGLLVVLACVLVGMLVAVSCILCATAIRRRLKAKHRDDYLTRSDTAETFLESTLINNNMGGPTYSAIHIDVE